MIRLLFLQIQFITFNKSCKLFKIHCEIKTDEISHYRNDCQYQEHEISQASKRLGNLSDLYRSLEAKWFEI